MANTHQPRLDNTTRGRWAAKLVREMYGATQADIAEDARISQSKLSLYESGFVDLAEKELRRLEKALNALKTTDELRPRIWPTTGKLSAMAGKFPDLTALDVGTFAEKYASWSKKKQIEARRSLRRQAHLTVMALAEKIGVPEKKLRQWEKDRAKLTDAEEEKWMQAITAARVEKIKADPWARLEVRIQIALENALKAHEGKILDDPLIAEIMESFRRENAELEQSTPIASKSEAD